MCPNNDECVRVYSSCDETAAKCFFTVLQSHSALGVVACFDTVLLHVSVAFWDLPSRQIFSRKEQKAQTHSFCHLHAFRNRLHSRVEAPLDSALLLQVNKGFRNECGGYQETSSRMDDTIPRRNLFLISTGSRRKSGTSHISVIPFPIITL